MVARRSWNLSPRAKHWRSMLVVLGVIVAMMAEPPHQGAGAPSSWLTQDGTPTAITTLTLAPVADAQVAEDNPDFSYGARTELLVNGGTDPAVASYLRFDVSGVNAPVQRATLRLWVRDRGGTQDGPAIFATDPDWSENGLTWTTRPPAIGGVLDDKEKLTSSTWVEYDVTPAVSGDGPIAFVLVGQSADGVIFHSREAPNPPQLVVLVGNKSPTPTPVPGMTPGPTVAGDAVLLAAGDIAECASAGDEATAALLDGRPGTIATLGDTVYEAGTTREFADCYDPSWGRHKDRTRPAVGNHEYLTPEAADYFRYFGAAAGDPQQGYYSYELGAWHIVVLNSNCSQVGGCHQGSPQEQWLRADLAAHPTACTLAYWHHPRFSFGKYDDNEATRVLWQVLQGAGAEIVLSGHDHNYQRYVPQDADGIRDDARGIRAFVVGTGGSNHTPLGTPPPTVEASNDDTFGILQLNLHPTRYDWQFVPIADQSFTDAGSGVCH
jgi:acid phosphatase type 7